MNPDGTVTAALAKGRVSRILLWAVLLGLGWITLIQVWAPQITQAQNQFVGNLAEAEQFIYGCGPLPVLVVGSSMVEAVDTLTGGKLQVLGMNGMSAREGLQVVLRSGRRPDKIAVELNGITALPNDAFIARLFNPLMMPVRERVLALRAEYQPASVIMSLARGTFGRGKTQRIGDARPESIADIRITQLSELYQQPPDMDCLRANLISVRDSVAALEARGISVIYFEYPVPLELSATPFHEARCAANVEILGEKAADALCFHEETFQTGDGIHLDAKGQQAFATLLEEKLLGARSKADSVR
jgi:hypothetical protein